MERAWQIGAAGVGLGYRMADLLRDRTPSIDKSASSPRAPTPTSARCGSARPYRADQGGEGVASYHGTADVLAGRHPRSPSGEEFVPGASPARSARTSSRSPSTTRRRRGGRLARSPEIAALLVEPVMTAAGMIEARRSFLQRSARGHRRAGHRLIFDEVVNSRSPTGRPGSLRDHPRPDHPGQAIGGACPPRGGGKAEIMDLLEPEAPQWPAPVEADGTFAEPDGDGRRHRLPRTAHAGGPRSLTALAAQTRERIDEIGRRGGVPLHATGLGS